jgi:hypothetical protein
MRSDALRSSDSIRILGFGDSVLNGGMETDHDSLATTIIERALNEQYSRHHNIRCLNISCENWGPDNYYAYLEEYGDFDADMIFLVVSSHDAYDNMDFSKVVDVHPHYPSKQSLSAIYEMVEYFILRVFAKQYEESDNIVNDSAVFNSGFSSFHRYAQEKGIPVLVYLHPIRQEIIDGRYDACGERIIKFCNENHIPLIEGLKHETTSALRDAIHLNEFGQKILANTLLSKIKTLLIKHQSSCCTAKPSKLSCVPR